MIVIHDKIENNTNIIEDTKLHGMIIGVTTVSKNAKLLLHGMITGNLILRDNSNVVIHGMIIGDVIVENGTLNVLGMVNGKIIRENGEVFIDPNAKVEDGYFDHGK